MLRCPSCDHQTPLKDSTVRVTVATLLNHYRNSGSELPLPPLTPQLLDAISTCTKDFLLSFAQENGLEAKETEDLLHSFKRTKLAILCRLSKKDIRERLNDVELAQLLYFKVQDSIATAATKLSTNSKGHPRRKTAPDVKVPDEKHLPPDETSEEGTEVYSKIMSSLGRVKTLGSSLSASFATTLEDSFEVETEEGESESRPDRENISSSPQSSSASSVTPTTTTAASVFAAAATTVSTIGSPLASFFQNLTHSTSVPPSPMKQSTSNPSGQPSVNNSNYTPSPSPSPISKQQHQMISPLTPLSPSSLSSNLENAPITPTSKTETLTPPTVTTTPTKKVLFEQENSLEADIRGQLSHTTAPPEPPVAADNGLQYTETAPKLLSSKIVSMAQNQKKFAEKLIGYTVKKSSEASGAAAKLMETRSQALKKKASTKAQSMFVGKQQEVLNSTPPPRFNHFVSSPDPCSLCDQTKEPKKILPINCIGKHRPLVCIPCFKHHLAIRCKNNQTLICPLPDCGIELVPKDIDALKNIGVCDESLQYKMHMEKLKTEKRKAAQAT